MSKPISLWYLPSPYGKILHVKIDQFLQIHLFKQIFVYSRTMKKWLREKRGNEVPSLVT